MFLFQVLFIGSWSCQIWLQLLPDTSISVKNTSVLSLNMLFGNTPGKVKKYSGKFKLNESPQLIMTFTAILKLLVIK